MLKYAYQVGQEEHEEVASLSWEAGPSESLPHQQELLPIGCKVVVQAVDALAMFVAWV